MLPPPRSSKTPSSLVQKHLKIPIFNPRGDEQKPGYAYPWPVLEVGPILPQETALSQCSLNCPTHVLAKGINPHTMHHPIYQWQEDNEGYVTYESSGRDTVRAALISDWMKGRGHEARDRVESSI